LNFRYMYTVMRLMALHLSSIVYADIKFNFAEVQKKHLEEDSISGEDLR